MLAEMGARSCERKGDGKWTQYASGAPSRRSQGTEHRPVMSGVSLFRSRWPIHSPIGDPKPSPSLGLGTVLQDRCSCVALGVPVRLLDGDRKSDLPRNLSGSVSVSLDPTSDQPISRVLYLTKYLTRLSPQTDEVYRQR
jgi:hypothetical protein